MIMLVVALSGAVAGYFICRELAQRFGGIAAFGTLMLLSVVFIDLAVAEGPFGFNLENYVFRPASFDAHNQITMFILTYIVGPASILGAAFGGFAGLVRRDKAQDPGANHATMARK